MRVNPNIQPVVLAGINASESSLQNSLQAVSTGLRVNLPSDDPTASAALVQNSLASANVDQYTKNVQAALGQAQLADSVLTSVVSLLTQAITLGTQGANGTVNAANRSSIATQVQGILSSVVASANTTYQGIAIFSGTATSSVAFKPDSASPTGYTYQGNSNSNQISAGDNLQVQVSQPGDAIFTSPSASVLGSLNELVVTLQTGSSSDIGAATGAVTSALNYVSAQHVLFGTSINQLNSQEAFLGQETVSLSAQANALVGVDPVKAAENLAQAQVHNSAVLAAAAKVLPTSLLDYLK